MGSLVFQQLSPNLEDQILGIFTNLFGISYIPGQTRARRERSPDPELGNVRAAGG